MKKRIAVDIHSIEVVLLDIVPPGLKEGEDFERVHYDIIAGENRQSDNLTGKNELQTLPVLELDDGTCLTESWPICEFIEEEHPEPNLRATSGRPMFEPRMPVVSEGAGAELSAMADEKWRWFDKTLGGSNHLALGRFTFADLIVFAFANFGFTIGWKLPEGTDNLARFVDTHNQRECAGIWQQAE